MAHPAAIAPYQLEIYRGEPDTTSELVLNEDIITDEITWSDSAPVPVEATYDLVLIDPIGRRSPPTRA